MTEQGIIIDHVTFSYRTVESGSSNPNEPTAASPRTTEAVRDVTISVSPGTCLLITGPSGSGKSSVLKLVNGLIPQLCEGDLEGTVSLAGTDCTSADLYQLGRITGTVFQNPRSQFFTAYVHEELAFAPSNAGYPRAEVVRCAQESADRWGINEYLPRAIDSLSGGELQKVACAAATSGKHRIMLFDEPTSNLSPAAIDDFAAVLARMKSDGWTLVIAEHRLYPLRDVADRVIVMNEGEVREDCAAADFFTKSRQARQWGLRSLTRPQPGVLKNFSEKQGYPETEEDSGISVEHLVVRYGARTVLDIPELRLRKGAVTALVGPNGAGKTTLARTLLGLHRPERGAEIRVGGRRSSAARRRSLGALVMQDVNRQLFAESVLGEVLLGNPHVTRSEAEKVLSDLGLAGYLTQHPAQLSGGQKQRLVIANAIVSGAEFYVFDEPTSGVDYARLVSIARNLRNLAERGATVLVISHDWEFINHAADTVLRLNKLADCTDGAQLAPFPTGKNKKSAQN